MKNYFKVLLEGCLKVVKGDKLFVTMSYMNQNLIEDLLDVGYQIGVDDISVDYYENNDSRAWGHYIENGAKFLFLIGENFNNTLANRVLNGFRCEDIGIDYLAAPTFDILSKHDNTHNYLLEKNALIGFSKSNSHYNKKITAFKNYKFNELLIRSLSGTNLRLEFDNDFKYRRNGVINMFPYYGIDIVPYKSSVNGFVDSSKPIVIDGQTIEGLRLCITDSKVVDFDGENNRELLNEVFRLKNDCRVELISLIGIDSPLYNYLGTYNHDVLDMNANPYILFRTKDNKKIYLPIESKSLSVIGVTNRGGNTKVYDKEKLLIL